MSELKQSLFFGFGVSPTFVLLCQLLNSTLLAQSTVKIEGHVFSATGAPLQGADVVVKGTGFGAATDATGYFAIENLFAGSYELQARFLGYQPESRHNVLVQKDLTTTVDFRLLPGVLHLGEIVVEAKRTDEPTTAFREVITADEIQRSGARSVGELLQHTPGIDLIDEGGGSGGKRISIRGSNTNQVLVLYDGVRVNDPLIGDVDLNQISLASVERIRITKGGNSSLFGSGALGGVVEIISKQTAVDELRLKGQFGNYGALGIQPALAGSLGKVNYFFNFEQLSEAGDFPYTYQKLDGSTVHESRLNADFSSKNYFGKINALLGHHTLRVQANLYRSTRGLPGQVFSWTPFAKAINDRRILIGSYSFATAHWKSQIQVSQHLNDSEFKNAPAEEAPLRFRTVPAYHTKYRILSHRGAFEGAYRSGKNQSVVFHTEVQVDRFKDRDLLQRSSGAIRATDNLNFSWAVRNTWHLPRPKFLTLVLLTHALRFDYFSFQNVDLNRVGHQLSPHVGLLLSRRKSWLFNFRTNWGRSFRLPTFADLFFQDFRVRGNPDLLPEKSWDFDAGLQVGLPVLGWLETRATFFRHNVENLITWELGSFSTYQPFNTNALLKGWEFGGSWDVFSDKLQLSASHVVLNALNKSGQRTTQDKKLTYRPEHTTKVGVQMALQGFSVDYHKRLVGQRFVTAANTVRLPSYSVDDLTFGYQSTINKIKVKLRLSVFNFLNERYEIVENAPLPGRNWRAGFELVY
ncbi:MAG: TonB-dependent receptor domain-containing protein [bacterium]